MPRGIFPLPECRTTDRQPDGMGNVCRRLGTSNPEEGASVDVGQLLQELESWSEKTSATGSPCTSYWVQLKSPTVRDERAYTASASRLMEKRQLWKSVAYSKAKEELAEMQVGFFGGHLGVNNTCQSQTAILLAAFEELCWQLVSTVWHLSSKPRFQNQESGSDARVKGRAPFERIAIDVTEPFP
jgi:hypothetical protein